MNRNFERAFELNHKTISISLTNRNPDFLKPLIISIDTFDLWEAELPNLLLSTYYPNVPQFDHNTFQANNYLFLSTPPAKKTEPSNLVLRAQDHKKNPKFKGWQ